MNVKALTLHRLAIEVAAHLGSWIYTTPTDADFYSVHLDALGSSGAVGARVYLQLVGRNWDNPERVEVSGYLNIGKNHQYVQVYDSNHQRMDVPSITVALSRGPEAIAKEITRRFLPEYLRIFAMAQAKVKAEAQYQADIHANLQNLASAIGKSIPIDEASGFSFSIGNNGAYGNVAAFTDDASLNLKNLTYTQATHILKYIGKSRQ